MRFSVENMGPLSRAEIDLSKRLVVFAGPNNAGKTYLAWSVYGLHRATLGPSTAALRWAQRLLDTPTEPLRLSDVFSADSASILDQIGGELRDQLHRCFAALPGTFRLARVHLAWPQAPPSFGSMLSFTDIAVGGRNVGVLVRDGGATLIAIADGDVESAQHALRHGTSAELGEQIGRLLARATAEERAALADKIERMLVHFLRDVLIGRGVVFPAERIATSTFARELALRRTMLVDEIVDAELEGTSKWIRSLGERLTGRYAWPSGAAGLCSDC